MKKIKVLNIETRNACFKLEVSQAGSGFVGEFFGRTPKPTRLVYLGQPKATVRQIGSGKLSDQNLEKLLVACRLEIEKIDGMILETRERRP